MDGEFKIEEIKSKEINIKKLKEKLGIADNGERHLLPEDLKIIKSISGHHHGELRQTNKDYCVLAFKNKEALDSKNLSKLDEKAQYFLNTLGFNYLFTPEKKYHKKIY